MKFQTIHGVCSLEDLRAPFNKHGDCRIAVLIRHAERFPIVSGSFGTDVLLTPHGIVESMDFGRALEDCRLCRIYTSPIRRCVQTAENIAKGISSAVDIVCNNNLGNPGFHISDANLAGKYFLQYGAVGVYERFTAGTQLAGIADMSFLRKEAMRWIDSKCESGGITLFVSHDSLIAHFAYANSICCYTQEDWIDYLDGIILKFPTSRKVANYELA